MNAAINYIRSLLFGLFALNPVLVAQVNAESVDFLDQRVLEIVDEAENFFHAGEFLEASQRYEKALDKLSTLSLMSDYSGSIWRSRSAILSKLAFIELNEERLDAAAEIYIALIDEVKSTFEYELVGKHSLLEQELQNPQFNAFVNRVVANPSVSDLTFAEIDTRIFVVPDVGYLRLIGRVVVGSTHCTGSIVASGIVLTNAHCIFNGGIDFKQGVTSKKEEVIAFRQEWLYEFREFTVTNYYTHTGKNGTWDGQARNDWVLLELESNSDEANVASFFTSLPALSDKIVASIDPMSSVLVAGYSSDRSDGIYMSLDLNCLVDWKNYNQKIVDHNCKVSNGSSGAPVVFLNSENEPTIVGLNVGLISSDSKKDFDAIMIPSSAWESRLQEYM